MATLGLKLQNHLSPYENAELAVHAERHDFDGVWISEFRWEPFVPMAVCAAATERIRIGSAIATVYTRSPAVLGMTAANLAQLAPGRVVLGLGTSIDAIVEGWHGRRRERPLQAAREYVEAVRGIVAGERVDYAGEVVSVGGFQLEHPGLAAPEIEIYAAALGERMLDVSGAVADGALLNLVPFEHLSRVRARIDAAAVASGRAPGSVTLAGDLRVAIAAGAEEAAIRDGQRREVAAYTRMGPYARFFEEVGFGEQAAASAAAWEAGDERAAAAAIDDAMLDSMMLIGDAEYVREGLGKVFGLGLDHAIVFPLWAEGADPAAATRALVEELAAAT